MCVTLSWHQRFLTLVETKELLHPSQIGVLPGHGIDHILTGKTPIDKHVNHQNEPIYACFVDKK